MRLRTAFLSLVMVVLFSVAGLYAQRGPGGPGGPAGPDPQMNGAQAAAPDANGPGAIGRCLAVVGLSDAQKADIKALVVAAAPALKTLHDTLNTDQDAVKAAVEAATPDPCAIGTAVLKVRADREAIETEIQTLRTKIEALLTVDQKLRLAGCIDGLTPPKP